MKGQSYIVEYIIMFGIAFAIFSTISYIFFSQTDFLSSRIGENSAKLVNKLSLMSIIKAVDCRSCDNITISQEVPQKIGGIAYNVSFNSQKISTLVFNKRVNATSLNLNYTYNFLGNANSNNKKIEIKINNKLKLITVED